MCIFSEMRFKLIFKICIRSFVLFTFMVQPVVSVPLAQCGMAAILKEAVMAAEGSLGVGSKTMCATNMLKKLTQMINALIMCINHN